MSRRAYPLEIILRHTGHAELVDADGSILWSSDADADFKDRISSEFLNEDDIDEILAFLDDQEILTEDECRQFENGSWDVTEESLEGNDSTDLDDDEDDDAIADDDGDEY